MKVSRAVQQLVLKSCNLLAGAVLFSGISQLLVWTHVSLIACAS